MGDQGFVKFNEILTRLFREILNLEEKALTGSDFQDITNNDMHVMDVIGLKETKNMSAIAQQLSVTVGSLTIAVNGLVKKGYVLRRRSEKDKRVVLLSLSPKGAAAYRHHQRFHREMVNAMLENLNGQETLILLEALQKIDRWILKNADGFIVSPKAPKSIGS